MEKKEKEYISPTVFVANDGFGYKQYAYFIKLDDESLLCIGISSNAYESDIYHIGEIRIKKDQNCMFTLQECSTFKLKDSPLWGTYLFNYFLKHKYGFKKGDKYNEK